MNKKNINITAVLIGVLIGGFLFQSCSRTGSDAETDIQETAQQVGDVMASIDEAGGSSGNINTASIKNSVEKTFARYAPAEINESIAFTLLLPQAEATACSGAGFSACNTGSGTPTITRSFGGCTVGTAVFSGDVTLTWSNVAACSMQSNGESVYRSPNFTVTGRRGATLAVSKEGTLGQVITRSNASVFTFTNDGINRKFTDSSSNVIFDQTTSTNSAITVTGANRHGRVLSGGSLRVRNNLTSITCDYVPNTVAWDNTCNCPVSGTWTGSCSSGKVATITITGCGTATYTEGSQTESITFDRCGN